VGELSVQAIRELLKTYSTFVVDGAGAQTITRSGRLCERVTVRALVTSFPQL